MSNAWLLFKVKKKRHQNDVVDVTGVFIVDFKHVSHIVLMLPLLTLHKEAPDGNLNKSSHPRCSVKKNILKNFEIFTGKHLFCLQSCNVIKKTLQHMYFPAKIFKKTYFEEHVRTAASFITKPTLSNITRNTISFDDGNSENKYDSKNFKVKMSLRNCNVKTEPVFKSLTVIQISRNRPFLCWRKLMYKQEKPPGFKFLRVNSWEINHVTSKCQMYFLKKNFQSKV